MAKEFLGRGWPFPLRPDAAGRLRYVEGEALVAQSLGLVLQTRVGERMMRPSFGSAVGGYLFAPSGERYLGLIEEAVREAARDWEPRVTMLAVHAAVDPQVETRVVVSIDYLVRRTNTRANLVFPFYLGGGEGP